MSEVGVLTGAHEWNSPVVMYYDKIGLGDHGFQYNERMFHGTHIEPYIMDLGRYWDNKENFFNNKLEGKVIRELEPLKDIVFRNKKYPFLFYTPDGMLPVGALAANGNILERRAPVEAKNVDSLLFHKYGNQLPPGYHHQITGEMIITESNYGEFWALVGGNNFQVFPMELDPEMSNIVLEASYKFWHKHVLPGKALAEEYRNCKPSEKDRIWYEIANHEPPPDSTEIYKKFISARFLGGERTIKATPAMAFMMRKYKAIDAIISRLTKSKNLIGNYFRSVHVKENAAVIEAGKDKSSFNKKLTISIKDADKEGFVSREIRKLKFEL